MKIILGIAGFLAILLATTAIVLLIIGVAKGKIRYGEGIKISGGWIPKLFSKLIILAIIGVAVYGIYIYFSSRPSADYARKVYAPEEETWQLCWLKKPDYEGKTTQRDKCLPAVIEKKTDSHLLISFSSLGKKGVQECTSVDGTNYDCEWRDPTGWGKSHLKFSSANSAFGWYDDEGLGDKQPGILEKIS